MVDGRDLCKLDPRCNCGKASRTDLITQGFYTNLIVWINIQTKYPVTNILPPEGMEGLGPDDITFREYGSKVTFVIEETMCCVQWGCKFCMILMFYKLT